MNYFWYAQKFMKTKDADIRKVKQKMFDVVSALFWVCLGAGVLAMAFVEYAFSKKRTAA